MANQDVARRREIKQDVDAVQRVVARQNTNKPMSGPTKKEPASWITCEIPLIEFVVK